MQDGDAAMATDDADQGRSGGIQVIHRAADILRFLQTRPSGVTQAEIGAALHLARTTVHRIVGALSEEGFVAARVDGARPRYRLGGEIARLAGGARRSLIDEMHPLLEEVSRVTDETADLSVLDGVRVTFIDQVVAPHRLRAVSGIGESFPAASTANGKALLAALGDANLPESAVESALAAKLEQVRAEGVAYDREEHTAGICAIGAVVGEVLGETVAISVPMPAQRFYGRGAQLRAQLLDVLRRHHEHNP